MTVARRESTQHVRLHIQNDEGEPQAFQVNAEAWEVAAHRYPELNGRLLVTIGSTDADFVAAMPTTEILVSSAGSIRARAPFPAPLLKVVFCMSAGVDAIAPFHWLPPQCTLVNNSGTHGPKAGEWGLMAILMLANKMPTYIAHQQARRYTKVRSSVVEGQTLVALGVGRLAGHTLRYAHRLGMHVIGVRANPTTHPDCDQIVSADRLDTVLPIADYLLITCPLTVATRGLINRARLMTMKSTAGIINMARGPIVDQDALCDLLDQNELGGAILDVVVPEPLPRESRLWRTRNLIITPHVSADDPNTYVSRSLEVFFENLSHWFDVKPLPNAVDPDRGY